MSSWRVIPIMQGFNEPFWIQKPTDLWPWKSISALQQRKGKASLAEQYQEVIEKSSFYHRLVAVVGTLMLGVRGRKRWSTCFFSQTFAAVVVTLTFGMRGSKGGGVLAAGEGHLRSHVAPPGMPRSVIS